MPITVVCGHCQASFNAKNADAGKRGKCPHCRGEVVVPLPQAIVVSSPVASAGAANARLAPARRVASPPPAVRQTRPSPTVEAISVHPAQSILDGFRGSIEPVSVAAGYKLGIALVVAFMLLLPVFYVALIGLICLLLGWHAVQDTGLLQVGHGRAAVVPAVAYVAPLLAGAILVFFMFKPLFARPVRRGKPRSLNREQEPLLFAFVDRVCAAVRAPRPSRIDVDCDVNASASFRRGVLSMLGNDLVLTIGLPLVAGLNSRQFAGVLAHEFGHFSQGAGMRLSYLVRSVSLWLTRVVYERDAWDARLIVWSRSLDLRLAIILYLARFFVWLTRKILWALMMLGHLISGFLMRQMEFDADCYEARLAGSDAFESTMRRLVLLGAATQGAYADLADFAAEGRLSDDLPWLIVANAEQITPKGLAMLERQIDEEEAGLFASHPPSRDRIARMRAEQAPGIFHVERPAATLFSDFVALSRTCTFDLYRAVFGKQFKLTDMHPVEQLLARQEQTFDDLKSLNRYFQGTFNVLRPLRLPATPLVEGPRPSELADRLKQARQATLEHLPQYKAAFHDYDQADTDWLEAEAADALLTAHIRVKPDDFKQRLVDPRAVIAARVSARGRLEQISPRLVPLEQLAVRRLAAALDLAHVDKVAARIPESEERIAESGRLRAAVSVVGSQVGGWLALRNRMAVLSKLLSRLEGQRDNATLLGSLEKNMSLLVRQIRDLQHELSRVRYPFEHATKEPTVAEFLVPQPFNERDWSSILSAGSAVLEGFPRLYGRMFGRLTLLAEEVEALLGLARLPEPPSEANGPG
ncbi:MAG TPA: M48 family metallopeptidase [Pirellulales bacterium]|nr:M48 family metallopeptidase [Pirellulales bacterium]